MIYLVRLTSLVAQCKDLGRNLYRYAYIAWVQCAEILPRAYSGAEIRELEININQLMERTPMNQAQHL